MSISKKIKLSTAALAMIATTQAATAGYLFRTQWKLRVCDRKTSA